MILALIDFFAEGEAEEDIGVDVSKFSNGDSYLIFFGEDFPDQPDVFGVEALFSEVGVLAMNEDVDFLIFGKIHFFHDGESNLQTIFLACD